MKPFIYSLLLAVIYFSAAKIGLLLAFVQANATPVWPPTGISIAALLLYGRRLWPGVFIGAFFANLTTAGTVFTSLGIAVGNTLESIAAVYLITRFAGGQQAFDEPKNILKYAVTVIFSTMISATFGVTTLSLSGFSDWSAYGPVWLTWWFGDLESALILAPFLILWWTKPLNRFQDKQIFEALLLMAGMILICLIGFRGLLPGAKNYPFGHLTLPFLIWAAFRFNQVGTITCVLIISVFAISGTLRGFGPFVSDDPNLSLLLLQLFLTMVSLTGITLAALVFQKEQTAQRLHESEQRFRQLAENIREVFYISDLRQPIMLYVSPGYEEIWGRTCESLYKNPKSFLENIHPSDLPRVFGALERHQQGQQTQEEYRVVRPDGSIRWILDRSFPVRNEKGQVYRVAGIAEDITDQKQYQKELETRADELGRSNKELEQFAYVSSHDLQEPLRKIIAFSERLRESKSIPWQDPEKDYFERMQHAALRMKQLLEDLLNYSRITVDSTRRRQPVDLNEIVRGVLKDLEVRVGELKAKVEIGDLPMVTANGFQMRQLFQNLIGNALKFHDTQRTPQINIYSQTQEGQISIFVEDNGIGFDEKYLDRIFKPFQRLHTQQDYEGSGVGLAICQKIVQQHGGRILAKSQIGIGALFVVHLPIKGD